MVIGSCNWLLEFLVVDILVLRVIKNVVLIGDNLRFKDELDIER